MKTKNIDLDSQVGKVTIRDKLEFLMNNNESPVYRPASKGVIKHLIPEWTKLVRSKGKELPKHLLELEIKYRDRVLWQRSNYQWKALSSMLNEFSNTLHYVERPVFAQDELETWVPVRKLKATSYNFSTEGADLSKSAGLPKFGRKRDQLSYAVSYANDVIKQARSLDVMYPIFPGYRTQQSPPDDPKVRGINMIPISTWVLERECWPSVIAQAKAHWNKPDRAVNYIPPAETWKLFANLQADGQCAVVLDASLYDTTVHANENRASVEYFIPDYEFSDLLIEYNNFAEILMPGGYIERNGGMCSGRTDTNFTDSWTNIADVIQSAGPISRYIVGYVVNGDDIIVVFNTQVDEKNITKLSHESRRNINPDKSDIRPNTAWFSKLYLDPDLPGWTKPGFLVLNSLMFKERESDAITSSKEYAAIAATSILSSMEYHPWGQSLRDTYWKRCDKYPVQSFGTKDMIPAMEAYQKSHSWMVEHGLMESDPAKAVNSIQSSWAAQVS